MSSTKPNYEAETRPNGRGGWEVAEPGSPAGAGIGNYGTEADAFAFARYNFDADRIKRGEPSIVIKSTPHPKAEKKSPFYALTKRLTKKTRPA
jgi:hypothetical protein